MPTTNTGFVSLGNPIYTAGAAIGSSFTLDEATDGFAVIFVAPKTVSLAQVKVRVGTRTGTIPTYRVGIQGVSDTNSPDGVFAAGYADTNFPATGTATLTVTTALTAGTPYALVVRHTSGTINGSNCVALENGMTYFASNGFNAPILVTQNSGGAWTGVNRIPPVSIIDADGDTILGTAAYSFTTLATWNSGTASKHRGSLWTTPFACRLAGLTIGGQWPTTADYTLRLYEGTNGTPVASVACDLSKMYFVQAFTTMSVIPFNYSLLANTAYRFVLEPTTVNNPTAVGRYVFDSAAEMRALFGPLCYTEATSPGTWTDYNAASPGFSAMPILPVIDQMTTGSGGSLVVPKFVI